VLRAVSTQQTSALTREAEFSNTIYNELTLFILQLVSDLALSPRMRLAPLYSVPRLSLLWPGLPCVVHTVMPKVRQSAVWNCMCL
jgi:hypothetical protein